LPDAGDNEILRLRQLQKHFLVKTGRFESKRLRAVDDLDLVLRRGESLGLVGESGSGKTTVARLITGLEAPSGGEIRFNGRSIGQLSPRERRKMASEIQMVFQDPHSSLNPRKTIHDSIAEPLIINTPLRGAALHRRVAALLATVRLDHRFLYRFPHELSGGQKQRVCIARAVALNPKLLVLDEPTSALDVSVQAQILEFLRELQRELDLTYLFISHNLAVVRYLCERVAVMYLGRVVETGPTGTVFDHPQHPYTEVLLRSVPLPEADGQSANAAVEGDLPSPLDLPPGCPFQTRCPKKFGPRCETELPRLRAVADGVLAACHLHDASGSSGAEAAGAAAVPTGG